jgi:hypothetical protein
MLASIGKNLRRRMCTLILLEKFLLPYPSSSCSNLTNVKSRFHLEKGESA